MKKQLSKIIAMTLVCAMTLPSAVFASSTAPTLSGNTPNSSVSGDITISGNGTVDRATYNLILPSNLDFAVDSFEVNGNGQIYGVDYPIVNASQFPVKVGITISSNSRSAVLVESDSDKLDSLSANRTAYLAAYVPANISVASVSAGAVSVNTISGNFTNVSANTAFPVLSGNAAEFSFKLGKLASPGADLSKSNVATFSWTGKVNTATKWADGDLSVESAFTITGLSSEAFTDLGSNSDNNLAGGGGGSTSIVGASSKTGAGGSAPITFDVNLGNATRVSSITFKNASGVDTPLAASNYKFTPNDDGKTAELKFVSAYVSTLGASKDFTVTFDNEKVLKVSITR